MTRTAAVAADVVLVPLQPGPFDLWSAGETQKVLDSADDMRVDLRRRKVRRLFVINRAHPSAVLSRNAIKTVARLDGSLLLPGDVVIAAKEIKNKQSPYSPLPPNWPSPTSLPRG